MSSSSTSTAKTVAEKRKALAIEAKVWWGEEECSNDKCTNHAYYAIGDKLLCGTHSRSNVKRIELPKNPDAKKIAAASNEAREAAVEVERQKNHEAMRAGTLTVCKYRNRHQMEFVHGVRNVYPNYWMGNRKDGFGCAGLSPMSLGPVKHNQPGVPESLNIENYHQFNKVYVQDTIDGAGPRSNPFDCIVDVKFFEMRNKAYRDPVPHRHKYPGDKRLPLFSIHVKPDGTIKRYTYVQSRYFYCHQYEILAKKHPDFARLREMLRQGYNLQIVGHDGHPLTGEKTLMEHYTDPDKPFGHERVLYTLLAIENSAEYPWNIYYEQNKQLYE